MVGQISLFSLGRGLIEEIWVLIPLHKSSSNLLVAPHLLQGVGDVWLHLSVLGEDQTGQQGGALLGGQWTQDVLEQQLRQQQLVAADLTGDTAL